MEHFALLAIDTSTEYCSVAVCLPLDRALPEAGGTAGAGGTTALADTEPDLQITDDPEAGLRYVSVERRTGSVSSTYILPAVEAALHAAGIALSDCRAIAFGAGPGSFTGLRTATGIVQGLAFGAGLPVVSVNTLLACAESTRLRGCMRTDHVVVAVDARMAECYWEAFEWSKTAGEWLTQSGARVGPPHAAAAPWAASQPYGLVGNAVSVFGDAMAAAAAASWTDPLARPSGVAIASIGWRAVAAGLAYPPARAQPQYIRDKVALTSAERAVERQQKEAAAAAARAAEAPGVASALSPTASMSSTAQGHAALPIPGTP